MTTLPGRACSGSTGAAWCALRQVCTIANQSRNAAPPIFNQRCMFMDINETIKSQLEENPVILYMKGTPQAPQCGFSSRTVQALMACGERFAFVDRKSTRLNSSHVRLS